MRRRFRLTCRELVELVTDYLEDALSRRDRTRFERHVSGCGACPAYLDQMRQTLALLGHLDEEALDPADLDALVDAFRGWKVS
jgi:anti-sigma factor RsiW